MEIALQRIKDERGQEPCASAGGRSLWSRSADQQQARCREGRRCRPPSKESYVLNDAILAAAQNLAHRPRQNRKIIFVISDGKEYGSRASYSQVLKVLLTDEIAVYAIGVDTAAMPLYNRSKRREFRGSVTATSCRATPMPPAATCWTSSPRSRIESAYQRITMEARNQYTLGYNTPQKPSSNYREIEVRVKRPGLEVFAKHGYYPLPPQRAEAPPLTADQPRPAATPERRLPAATATAAVEQLALGTQQKRGATGVWLCRGHRSRPWGTADPSAPLPRRSG